MNSSDEIASRKQRLFFIGIAWVAALVATMPHPMGIVWAWAFPAGLLMFFTHKSPDFVDIAIGWVIHIVLVTGAVATRRTWLNVALYILICVALALNVAGCREFVTNLDDLH